MGVKSSKKSRQQEQGKLKKECLGRDLYYALTAYSSSSSDSEVSNDSTCSKSCLETVKLLKSQYDQLLKDFKKSELMVLESQIVDNCEKGLGYNVVLPPYTGNFMPQTPDLSFTSLDEFVNEHVVDNYKAISSEEEPKVVKKSDDAPVIEEWVLDSEEENVSQPKAEKKIVALLLLRKSLSKSNNNR
ncbi:hypothetical protein Tco_0874831 [Tanacetum coccineum]|uniref:Uncharacterized protein n=1 Tax=Tanacetum coccineum TaxID=301880 RepID=A0ABQ5BMQ4_9ASTR